LASPSRSAESTSSSRESARNSWRGIELRTR
jgi:hypothetical protein